MLKIAAPPPRTPVRPWVSAQDTALQGPDRVRPPITPRFSADNSPQEHWHYKNSTPSMSCPMSVIRARFNNSLLMHFKLDSFHFHYAWCIPPPCSQGTRLTECPGTPRHTPTPNYHSNEPFPAPCLPCKNFPFPSRSQTNPSRP